MNVFDAITDDIPLESFRALVVAGLFIYMYVIGRRTGQSTFKGWHQLLGGFGLLLFASVLDVTDNFEQLNRYVIIGDTHGQAFLEKVVGYLGGFILLFIGFMRWLPMVVDENKTLEHKALIETQQRYRDLIDLSPDAIILHSSGKIIYANAAAADLIGVQSPEAIIGKSTMDFVHPDYQDQTRARLESLSVPNTKNLPLINIKAVTSSGEVRDVEVASGITNFHGEKVFQSVLRDISARVRAEEALKESEIDLRAILDSMAEFYYRADMDGSIVRASGAAHEVTGWNRDEIIGMKLAERYVDEGGREKFLAALREKKGVIRNYEVQLLRRDEERRWVSINAHYHRDKNGDINGVEGTVRDITETVQARDVLQHMAMHDVLTGLGNRRSFEVRLKEALSRARRAKAGGAILYFDLDGFKAVNDTHGHDLGDSVLRQAGKRLKTFARETDYAARVGGDEFCLIIEGVDEESNIDLVATKLVAALAEPYIINDITITLGASVGVVPFDGNEGGNAVHALITGADQAMYKAKKSGGNAHHFAQNIPPSKAPA